jgi:preprotein translocase subunit Sec63
MRSTYRVQPMLTSNHRYAALLLLCVLLVSQVQAAKDPYQVLGVKNTANAKQIKKAFHKLALQYHPDKVSMERPVRQLLWSP